MITLVVLSRMDILGRYYVISVKGDNFCDLLFALMYAKPLLKRGLLYKERICSLWEQILSLYRADPFSEGDKNNIDRVDFLESESLPHKISSFNSPYKKGHSENRFLFCSKTQCGYLELLR